MKHSSYASSGRPDQSVSVNTHKKGLVLKELVPVLLSIILMYAGLNKLISNHTFHFELSLTPNLKSSAGWLTWVIPSVEITIASLLFFQRTKRVALYMSVALFCLYIVAMFQLKLYVPNLRGGVLNTLSFKQYIFSNSILLILSLMGLALLRRRKYSKLKPEEKTQEVVFT